MASREVSGVLTTGDHNVWISPSAGPDAQLLGSGTVDSAEIVLNQGLYTITLSVEVLERYTHWAYDGSVRIWWEDAPGVAADASSWGAVKALYR